MLYIFILRIWEEMTKLEKQKTYIEKSIRKCPCYLWNKKRQIRSLTEWPGLNSEDVLRRNMQPKAYGLISIRYLQKRQFQHYKTTNTMKIDKSSDSSHSSNW